LSILLEVCVDSFASALAAKVGGADRLEVCSALAIGGTTPSFGLVEQCVAELQMPVMMMIRPHDGGFVYDNDHVNTMLRNIKIAKSIGVQGIVFGALTPEKTIDRETCQRLIEAAGSVETTFHRAFDIVPDPLRSLAELEAFGFDRVLTSGQQTTAIAGANLIRKLVAEASVLKVVAGAGVNAQNVCQLIEQTGVQEVHASASVPAMDAQTSRTVSFGPKRRLTCADKVQAIKDAIARTF
jgi:copper homeostasis protein